LGEWKTCQSLEREATPERILFHASFGSHSNSFSYGISPSQHHTMIEHAEKWSIRNIRKKKAVLININICARILAPALCRPSCFESSA
jgi:hypothetical protein